MSTRTNVVVLHGTVSKDPTSRVLPSGDTVVQFDLRTVVDHDDTHESLTVPISWIDPPAAGLSLIEADADLVVAGTVKRRFFRVGAQTQSRTEVVVDRLVPTRRKKSVRSLMATIAADLTQDCG